MAKIIGIYMGPANPDKSDFGTGMASIFCEKFPWGIFGHLIDFQLENIQGDQNWTPHQEALFRPKIVDSLKLFSKAIDGTVFYGIRGTETAKVCYDYENGVITLVLPNKKGVVLDMYNNQLNIFPQYLVSLLKGPLTVSTDAEKLESVLRGLTLWIMKE